MSTRAAIDLGSSSVKMLVIRDGAVLVDRRIGCNLGKELAADGTIPERNQVRTLHAIGELLAVAREHGIRPQEIPLISTAAVRNAPNGSGFIERVKSLGIVNARILDGNAEAQIGYRAATTPLRRMGPGRFATIDLGGGSFQLAIGDENGMHRGGSTQVGSNRIQTELMPLGAAVVDEKLRSLAPMPLPLEELKNRKWAAVGGIALFLREHFGSDRIARSDVEALRDMLFSQTPEELIELLVGKQSMEQRKALGTDTKEGALDAAQKIPAKLTLLLHILKSLNLDELFVSDTDARHVLIEEQLAS